MVLAQVIVFNHLCLFGVAVPLVFIYFILCLPIGLSVNWIMTWSFLIGLTIDIFSDTPGMNALSCTLAGLLRHPVLKLYLQRDDNLVDKEPSIAALGPATYIKYALTMTLLYCTMFFIIESMTFHDILLMLARIGASTLLTSLIITGLGSIRHKS